MARNVPGKAPNNFSNVIIVVPTRLIVNVWSHGISAMMALTFYE
jgi:hypothetical protein